MMETSAAVIERMRTAFQPPESGWETGKAGISAVFGAVGGDAGVTSVGGRVGGEAVTGGVVATGGITGGVATTGGGETVIGAATGSG